MPVCTSEIPRCGGVCARCARGALNWRTQRAHFARRACASNTTNTGGGCAAQARASIPRRADARRPCQVIKRDEKDNLAGGDPHEVWYRFSGRQIGYVGNNGSLDTTYAQSIANRTAAQGNGAFFNGAAGSTNAADFDLAYDAVNSYAQGSNAGMYVVQQGDTLSSIAAALWGDANLWYKLAEVNGLTAESTLPEGLPLLIPSGVVRDTNNAQTFKPYDPNEIMGNLSPTATAPPKGKKCGAFGQILLAVIAVVVAVIVTAGAAAAMTGNTFGSMLTATMNGTLVGAGGAAASLGGGAVVGTTTAIAAGAIGGAAGSIVSQGIGVATGIQEKFSWNAVALAAIGGGIGAGGGKLGVGGDGVKSAIARGMVANIITQGVGTATGLQKQFSWASVAAAGVGAGFARAIGGVLPPGMEQAAAKFVTSSAAAIGNAATHSLIEGTDFGDNIMAALPDVIGQTIGEAIAGAMTGTAASGAGTPRTPSVGKTPHTAKQVAALHRPFHVDIYQDEAAAPAPRRSTGFFEVIGDWLGLDGNFGYDGPAYGSFSGENWSRAFNGQGSIEEDEIIVPGTPTRRWAPSPGMFPTYRSHWRDTIDAIASEPRQVPTYQQARALEDARGYSWTAGPTPFEQRQAMLEQQNAARLGMMFDTFGANAYVIAGALGGDQQTQDRALIAGSAFGALAGAAAGPRAFSPTGGRYAISPYAIEYDVASVNGLGRVASRPPNSPNFSVLSEARLSADLFTARDGVHFRYANRRLYEQMVADPVYAAGIESQFPGTRAFVTPGSRGGVPDTSPPGLTWHHDPYVPGNLQLIPRVQHSAPGPVQRSLHPDQQGGREIWGGGNRR